VREAPRASTDAGSDVAGVDQVSAARDWLRRHGVDPGEEPGPALQVAARRRPSRVRVGGGSASVAEPSPTELPGDVLGGDVLGGDEAEGASAAASARPSGRRGGRGGRRSREQAGDGEDPASGSSAGGSGALGDPDADPEEVARGIVLRKLAVQARTRAELERALQGRAVPEDAATTVLDRMTEVGLVDDVTFAHDWVSSRQQRRHLSRTALRRELQTKGVDREVIDDALADVAVDDEHRAALDLARRRAATMGGLAREVAYRRLGGMLARRGFSAAITTRVLSEVLGNWTEG
jgi:regulatory protein